jgi:activating signal cointegrator complex subunit 3
MKKLNPKAKCVCIAPLKSLARERLREWRERFGGPPLHWQVVELSGDTHHDNYTMNKADILVSTPEKWDLISRGWRRDDGVDSLGSFSEHSRRFVKDVRLLIIDEIHLLGEERGAVLEAIVSRTRFISKFIKQNNNRSLSESETTRIIGLSTSIANPFDLADWIGIKTNPSEQECMKGLYNFRASVRPVPMVVHISGFSGKHFCGRMASMNKLSKRNILQI